MRLLSLFAALALPAFVLAAPVPKDKEKAKDEDTILGTWKIEKFDTGGGNDTPPKEIIDAIRFVFEKDGVLRMTGGPGGDTMSGSFKIDPAAKVKTIDMTMTPPGGGAKPETMLGLYELDGDTLKLCMTGRPNSVRPEEFKANGKDLVVVTFARVKDEKKDEKKDK